MLKLSGQLNLKLRGSAEGTMFESAELGHKIDKATYKNEVPKLREDLLQAQLEMLERKDFQFFIIISGVDGAGKGETIRKLNEWLDPRQIETNAMTAPSDEEAERPFMWRYWRVFPPKGKIGVFVHSWYSEPILQRVNDKTTNSELDQAMDRIVNFERMLCSEDVIFQKFWLHLSRQGQEKRFKTLEKSPKTSWMVTDTDWKHLKMYDKFMTVNERVIRQTSTANSPWMIIEGADANYRELTVGKAILEAMRHRLDMKEPPTKQIAMTATPPKVDNLSILKSLDLSLNLEKKKYKSELSKYQGKLALLTRKKKFKDVSVVMVFEGNDAAGKGGSIRRVTGALDPRIYRVVPIAAPTQEEKEQPYLWRFWRHLPRRGRIVIFDRSWYGRVLVERIEGFASKPDWLRAYEEINDFEEQLIRNKTLIAKFWLTISPEEQLARFKAREETGYKRYKITDEDWRNREKFEEYSQAVCDMVDRTSTAIAPWTIVEANDKYYARVKVIKTVCELLKKM